MGVQLFDRIAEITIYPKNGGNAVIITSLAMKFQVSKKKSSDSNTASATIYNLSKNTIEQIGDTDVRMQIRAGYNNSTGLELLFTGDISEITHSYSGSSVETVIKTKDGGVALRDSKINKSYSAGAGVKQMIKDAVKSMGLPVKIPIDKIPIPDIKISNSQVASGSTKSFLDNLVPQTGFEWVVNNGIIELVKKDSSDDNTVVVLSSSSGMIGSPKKISIKTDGNSKNGWEVKSLLQPNILPLGIIEIRSNVIPNNAQYKVIEVEHSCDTESGDWFSNIKVINL